MSVKSGILSVYLISLSKFAIPIIIQNISNILYTILYCYFILFSKVLAILNEYTNVDMLI